MQTYLFVFRVIIIDTFVDLAIMLHNEFDRLLKGKYKVKVRNK